MARILIVGGGCRGRRLAGALVEQGNAVRMTTRAEHGRAAIEEAGAECWIGTPDRIATLREALASVTVVCWLLGTAAGEVDVLHGSRLEFMLRQVIDTTARGFVYEAAGSVDAAALARGSELVRAAGAVSSIPVAILDADPADERAWDGQAHAAIAALLRGSSASGPGQSSCPSRAGAGGSGAGPRGGRRYAGRNSIKAIRIWEGPSLSEYAKDVLVETSWLEEHLDDDSIRIVEVDENPQLYADAHIPGAIGFDWKQDLQDQVRRDFLGPREFGELFGSRGISDEHTVVLYGDRNNWFAAYTYWYLKYYGHERVLLVNGPREKWIGEGRPTTQEVPRHAPATFSAKPGDDSIRARREEVLAALDADVELVDVRSPQEYSGELIAMPGYEQEGAQRAGHIPGAASIPWAQAVKEDGTFKSAEDLRELYGAKGVLDGNEIIAYCRIGERSAHTWFVLHELLGKDDVKNYDGSWTEWGSLVSVPVEKGA